MGLIVRGPFFIWRKGRNGCAGLPPFQTRDHQVIPQNDKMIIFVSVNFKRLLKQKRNYNWPRPQQCPCCQASGIWGHGFVLAYFDGLGCGVYLRRYRCRQCHCVMRLRPGGYFPRFQAAIGDIVQHLNYRISTGGYVKGISRSRQRHWLVGLMRNTAAYLGQRWLPRLIQAFDKLWAMRIVPVSRRI